MMDEAMKIKIPYILESVDRHGNVRIYFNRRGFPRIRIRERVGTEEFWSIYNRLKLQVESPNSQDCYSATATLVKGTWRALCVAYFSSATFKSLHNSTQRARRRILEGTLIEPLKPGSQVLFGDLPVHRFTAKAVKVLRDRKAELPAAANGRIKAISTVFSWALEDEQPGVISNPSRDVKRIKTASSGWHTWTDEEVAHFENHFPIGSKPRLAMAIMLFAGVRRSDCVRLGRPHVRGSELHFTPTKNKKRKPFPLIIPILPGLQTVIKQSQLGDLTWLITDHGIPFTPAGFGKWFREKCNEAGLSHCSAHGLRKAGSRRAAENGATPYQLMAMFGWSTIQQAEVYTKAARQRRLARDGMQLIEGKVGTNRD